MEGISVTAKVLGEDVTFREPGFFTLMRLVKKARKAWPSSLSITNEMSEGDLFDALLEVLDNDDFVELLSEVLAAFAEGKDAAFFKNIRAFSDAEAIFEVFSNSEFTGVIKRFFDRLMKTLTRE